MKIVTLFFACVALLSLKKVGAMNNDSGAGHGRVGQGGGTANQNPHSEVGAGNKGGTVRRGRDGTAVHRAWARHAHTHSADANRPRKFIFISKVVNGKLANSHLLKGYLVPDFRIASCNGPHGYAVVDLSDSERLYACIRPSEFYQESRDMERNDGVSVLLATIVRSGRPSLEADLAPRDARSTLNSHQLLYHGGHEINMLGSQRVGHVRYVKSDPINPIDVDGDLYEFPRQGLDYLFLEGLFYK